MIKIRNRHRSNAIIVALGTMTPTPRDFELTTAPQSFFRTDEPQLSDDSTKHISPKKQQFIKTKSGMTYPKRGRF